MYFPKLQLTNAGTALIVKALSGETLTFTKLALGDGDAPENQKALTDLVSTSINIPITSIDVGTGTASLLGSFDNSDLTSGVYARELGVYARDGANEVLYAYANAGSQAEYIPGGSSSSFESVTLKVLVAVGDARQIEAVIGEFAAYATKEELQAHESLRNNPHGVTKDDVGLGNVPNVTTNNQTVTFRDSSSVDDLATGDTLAVLFGKISKAIKTLKTHLNNRSNPHGVTLGQLTGTLPLNKGGTGATNAAGAEQNIMPVSEISINNFCSILSGAIVNNPNIRIDSGFVRKVGRRIFGYINVANATSTSKCSLHILQIANNYRPSASSQVGMINAITYNGTKYESCAGFILNDSRQGMITIVCPEANTAYNRVEITFDYYIV